MTELQVQLLAIGSIALSVAVIIALEMRKRKIRRRAHEGLSNDECMACGNRDVLLLGENAYRCSTCGHEGGEGLPALMETRRTESFATMQPNERRRSGRNDLDEAQRLLTAARGTVAYVLEQVEKRRRSSSRHDVPLEGDLLYTVLDEIELARRHLNDAAIKLEMPGLHEGELTIPSMEWTSAPADGLDTAREFLGFELAPEQAQALRAKIDSMVEKIRAATSANILSTDLNIDTV